MYRRASNYFRNRSSVAVVSETRGTPLKAISVMLGVICGLLGFRYFFKCGRPFTSYEWEQKSARLAVEVFGECDTNLGQKSFSMVVGAMGFLIASMRFRIAFTAKVAELYHMMSTICLFDALILVMMLQLGPGSFFWGYNVLVAVMCGYEGYVLVIARRAYISREKLKDFMNKIED